MEQRLRAELDGRWVWGLVLLLAAQLSVGCAGASWLAHGLRGEKRKTVYVTAKYVDLANKRVVVMVSATEYTLFQYPNAPRLICREMTNRIATHVAGVTVMNPKNVDDFQMDNPHWTALRYGELIERMGVDRIVLVDLFEYRTHEPGNAHLWQGVVAADVGVIEIEAQDPDHFGFETMVYAQFPEESKIGMPNSNDQIIELGMLKLFGRDAAGLFYDYEVEQ